MLAPLEHRQQTNATPSIKAFCLRHLRLCAGEWTLAMNLALFARIHRRAGRDILKWRLIRKLRESWEPNAASKRETFQVTHLKTWQSGWQRSSSSSTTFLEVDSHSSSQVSYVHPSKPLKVGAKHGTTCKQPVSASAFPGAYRTISENSSIINHFAQLFTIP